jgi:hypothetical protein
MTSPTLEGQMDLTTQTPAEIDAAWAEAMEPVQLLELKLRRNRERAVSIMDDLEAAQIKADRGLTGAYLPLPRQLRSWEEQLVGYNENAEALRIEIAEAEKADEPYVAEWDRRGGWSRYHIVSGGHLHHQSCHTLSVRTMVGLLTEASGMDTEEVVTRYDVVACTHCFPDAPVEIKPPGDRCPQSGEVAIYNLCDPSNLPHWEQMAVRPEARCECGYVGAITAGGFYRKHDRGGA